MMITIGAMIGCGKTSLAEIIAEEFNSQVYYESVDDNPILEKFYTCTEDEIQKNRYPFLLQLWFLNTRFKSIKEALLEDNNVLDRSIYEDWYFCKINRDLGRISDLEFGIYEGLLNNMMEEIESLPKKSPDLMVYLHGSFDTVLNRIKMRGREYELDSALVDYYRILWEGYDSWIDNHYNASEVLKINIDNYDYVNNEQDRVEVVNLIKNKLKEIKG